jgi:hypothetical protein
MTEDERLHLLDNSIDLAFNEPDPFMREVFFDLLMRAKWVRIAILQGGFK